MAGIDLQVIREALAAWVRPRVARGVNVNPYPPTPRNVPCVSVVPADDYITYHQSFGDNMLVQIFLDLEVAWDAADIDAQIAIDDLLSTGTGQDSSLIDALETPGTSPIPDLGGAVGNVTVFSATGPSKNDDETGFTATLRVGVLIQRS